MTGLSNLSRQVTNIRLTSVLTDVRRVLLKRRGINIIQPDHEEAEVAVRRYILFEEIFSEVGLAELLAQLRP